MELSEEQSDRLNGLSEWVNESGLNFRKDADFLLLFLRSCDFDLDLSKKTMRLYYKTRKEKPEYWTNRDVNKPELNALCRNNVVTILIDGNVDQPVIGLAKLSRLSDEDSGRITQLRQVFTLSVEVGLRRPNCQLNGAIGIFDLRHCPMWAILTAMRPYDSYYMIRTFGNALPVQMKALVFLNCTYMCYAALKTLLFLSPAALKRKIHCFGSDWAKLGQVVPLELLPEEYGGSAGPFQKHDEAFFEEVLSFNEYFLDDDKYGL